MTLPLVSIISINYNSLADTLEFLRSLQKISYTNYEVIIVDNASKVNPRQEIESEFPNAKVIVSKKNLGFAGGNNLGLQQAKGKYILYLNNDTLLPPNFLEPLVDFMETHPDAGMASPKVLYPDGKTIQYAGAQKINAYTGRGKRLGLFEEDQGQYDKICKTDLGHGAALIVPKSVIDLVGPMPELYFLYYEEHDWCEQVKRKGYHMYYVGTTSVIHKESISVGGEESYTKVFYLNRNRLLFLLRNVSGLPKILGVLFFLTIATPKNLLKYVSKGKFSLAKAILKGLHWNLFASKNKWAI
jgi:GT2 family glycosyltransferase